jgi:hypothetical protein
MAIIDPWSVPISINTQDYAIKGQMIAYQMVINEWDSLNFNLDTNEIKEKLVMGLVEEIMKYRIIEFTKQSNPAENSTIYRARLFAVPDDMVRVLRISKPDT